jgi:hypothetical protein
MSKQYCITTKRFPEAGIIIILSFLLIFSFISEAFCESQDENEPRLKKTPYPKDAIDLGKIPYKI